MLSISRYLRADAMLFVPVLRDEPGCQKLLGTAYVLHLAGLSQLSRTANLPIGGIEANSASDCHGTTKSSRWTRETLIRALTTQPDRAAHRALPSIAPRHRQYENFCRNQLATMIPLTTYILEVQLFGPRRRQRLLPALITTCEEG